MNILILLIALLAGVAAWYFLRKKVTTWGDVSVDIAPYIITGLWLDGETWRNLADDHVMIEGTTYAIQVSQSCILSWNGYHFPLAAGNNTIVWEQTVAQGVQGGIE